MDKTLCPFLNKQTVGKKDLLIFDRRAVSGSACSTNSVMNTLFNILVLISQQHLWNVDARKQVGVFLQKYILHPQRMLTLQWVTLMSSGGLGINKFCLVMTYYPGVPEHRIPYEWWSTLNLSNKQLLCIRGKCNYKIWVDDEKWWS